MKPITKILAPTDFSPAANNALNYAVGLAKEIGAKLYVLHAYRIPAVADTAYPIGGMYPEGMVDMEDVQKEINAEMEKIKTDYLYSPDLKFETITESGFAQESILEYVDKLDIDLIVMGTRGSNALQELFGSTTSHIINNTKVPILVIPREVRFEKVDNIVLATDYKKTHKPETYDALLNMVDIFHADVDVLHVRHEVTKMSGDELDAGEELDRILKKTRHSYHYNLENENVNEGIEKFLKDHQSSMLAMVPRKHSLIDRLIHGSKTQHMIFHTQKPLLVLKD